MEPVIENQYQYKMEKETNPILNGMIEVKKITKIVNITKNIIHITAMKGSTEIVKKRTQYQYFKKLKKYNNMQELIDINDKKIKFV